MYQNKRVARGVKEKTILKKRKNVRKQNMRKRKAPKLRVVRKIAKR